MAKKKTKKEDQKTEAELLERLRELRSKLHEVYVEEKKAGISKAKTPNQIKDFVTKPRSKKQVSKIDKISSEIDEIIGQLHTLGTKAA